MIPQFALRLICGMSLTWCLMPRAEVTGRRSVVRSPDPSRWLYVPSWKRLLPGAVGLDGSALETVRAGTWLVYADEVGVASAVSDRLTSAGHDVVTVRAGRRFQQSSSRSFTIEPGNARDHDRLVRALQSSRSVPDRIVHAWSVTALALRRPPATAGAPPASP